MFTRVLLQNFKSFSNLNFDLTDWHNEPQKLIVIYGENGIGKSNLASAFYFLTESLQTMNTRDYLDAFLLENKNLFDNKEQIMDILSQGYKSLEKLIDEYKMIDSDEPMLLKYEFLINGKKGSYTIETNNDRIIHERLEYLINQRRGTYFDLTPNSILINKEAFNDVIAYTEFKRSCEKYWGKYTLLSILMHESSDKTEQYIKRQINPKLLDILSFFSSTFSKVHSGNINEIENNIYSDYIMAHLYNGKINIKYEPLLDKAESIINTYFTSMLSEVNKAYYKRRYDETQIKYKLYLSKQIEGKTRDIEISDESTGTQMLLEYLPYFLNAAEGKTSVIDEFDTGLHSHLLNSLIISIFNSIEGQMILTTHDIQIMNSPVPKKCFYIISNNAAGIREIKNILEYDNKIDSRYNVPAQYLSEKYGKLNNGNYINFTKLLSAYKTENNR